MGTMKSSVWCEEAAKNGVWVNGGGDDDDDGGGGRMTARNNE